MAKKKKQNNAKNKTDLQSLNIESQQNCGEPDLSLKFQNNMVASNFENASEIKLNESCGNLDENENQNAEFESTKKKKEKVKKQKIAKKKAKKFENESQRETTLQTNLEFCIKSLDSENDLENNLENLDNDLKNNLDNNLENNFSSESGENFENEFEKTEGKTKLQKRKIVTYCLKFVIFLVFGIVAVAGGFVVGDLVIGKIDTFDPSKFNALSYRESEANIQKWSTKSIDNLTPVQIFVVAQRKIQNCEYYSVSTKGYNGEDKGVVTTLGMKQDLYGYRFRNYNDGYFDYFSTGLATVVKKTEFKFSEDKFYSYEGKMNGATVDWSINRPESGLDYRTKEEYKQMVGCDAQDPIDYIVSTQTVLEEKTNEKVGNLHSFTLKLNPETAVLDYVIKMDYMSGFGYPKFSSIELRFEVDDEMNFQNIYINENYKVIGMSANSKYKMEFSYENIELR